MLPLESNLGMGSVTDSVPVFVWVGAQVRGVCGQREQYFCRVKVHGLLLKLSFSVGAREP